MGKIAKVTTKPLRFDEHENCFMLITEETKINCDFLSNACHDNCNTLTVIESLKIAYYIITGVYVPVP